MSIQLSMHDVAFSYPKTSTNLFSHISFSVDNICVGIVGDNGCGKTTLAKIAAGILQATEGKVTHPDLCVYCSQKASLDAEDLMDFASDYSLEAIDLRLQLDLDDSWLWRPDTLSEGQKKRLQLALCLAKRPDMLIVDEPTNHVDATAREAIIAALSHFSGLCLLISHDRELLDAVCQKTLYFSRGSAELLNGSYTLATQTRAMDVAARAAKKQELAKEQVRLSAERQRRKEVVAGSKARLSNRDVDAKDHDEKGKRLAARLTGKDTIAAEFSKRLDKRLDTIRSEKDSLFIEKRYNGELLADITASKRSVLAHINAGKIAYGPDIEDGLQVPDLYIGPTDHIALIGPNGTGKSTLIKHIENSVPKDINHLYLPQELSRKQKEALFLRLEKLSKSSLGQVYSIVAQLNSEPDHLVGARAASPGEIRKLMLALAILDKVELLLLDEPTNHLDIHSVEALENFLASYPAAFVLITHDGALCQNTCSTRWKLSPTDTGAKLDVL